jgi:type IV fimbrial biogenesis protein FimT
MRRAFQAGISLVEVMVVVFIVGIMIALGIPSFQTWVQNSQIRTASEAIINGLQTAKNEAIRRNSCMQIAMTGKGGWAINPCSDPLQDPPFAGRSAAEGSSNADVGRQPPTSTIVSFNALGRVVSPNPSDGSDPITRVDVCNPTMTGSQAADARPLRIAIPPGGNIRMCDPSPLLAPGDPRICTDVTPIVCPN